LDEALAAFGRSDVMGERATTRTAALNLPDHHHAPEDGP